MSEKDLIFLEEVLLGYLRSSKKIKLTSIDSIEQEDNKNKYTISFIIDKDFASTLVNNLNNQFADFFKANSKEK